MKNLDINALKSQLVQVASRLYKYRVMLFFLLLASIYGFLLLQINLLSQAEPTPAQLDGAQSKASSLKVDPQVVQKIQQLQDNSVNVQSLFDQARNNPFQE